MNNYEMLCKMLEMQRELDKAIIMEKAKMLDYPSPSQYCSAIIDEIGELNHELKPEWWKKNPGEVDRDKVLEELVDIWHFCLSFANSVKYKPNPDTLYEKYRVLTNVVGFTNNIVNEITKRNCEEIFKRLLALSHFLRFEMYEVYMAYIKKNEVNHQRAESDY